MRTMGFCKIEHKVEMDGSCVLMASCPRQGTLEIRLTPDELMILLVNISNALVDARSEERQRREERELRNEQRRIRKARV
jgi:hypothetical protein